jgi:hypothetical protein
VTTVQRSIKPGKASKPTARAACPKNAVSWILLADALALMADFYQDWWLAQGTLCKAFVELEVRNRAARALAGWICEQGQGKEYEHNLQLSDLWRQEYFAPNWRPYSKLQIHWQESSATLETDVCTDARSVTVRFYRIEVAREDLLKLFPEGYDLPQQQHRIEVAQEDLLKLFPEGYDLPQQQPAPRPQRKRGGGRPEQYEWDRVFAQFLRLIEDDGWPKIQSHREFAKRVCDACAEAGMEPTPSVDTVRDKISIWVSARGR